MEERGKRQFDAAVQGKSSLSHKNEKKSKSNIRKINSNTKTSSTENVRDEESRSSTSEENSQTTKSRFLFHI